MSVRTYNPSVRVGNWNEDIQLEEDALKDFLERRERGQLLIQRSANLKNTVLGKVGLSTSRDGKVRFGDKIMLVNPGSKDGSRKKTVLSVNMPEGAMNDPAGMSSESGVTASTNVEPCSRTALIITSSDGSPEGSTLKYGQSFYLRTVSGDLFLHSDTATFRKAAKKSRHNVALLVKAPDHRTEWMVVSADTQYRLEMEFCDVPVNQKIILTHVKTNQNLCVEENHLLTTPFGREFEVSGHTDLDSHKAEKDVNHWILAMQAPGDNEMAPKSPEEEEREAQSLNPRPPAGGADGGPC